jgi:two-component sensor histidine kinase
MGFALPHVRDGANAIEDGRRLLQEHVALQDRARFAAETEALEAGHVRKIEYRVVGDDGKERWIESEWHLEVGPDAAPVRTFVANLDITERKQSEEQKKLLMAEINHRSKNLLSVVQAIVTQSARRANPETFASNLSDRLQGLSASQDLLIKSDWHGIEMSELIKAQLYHFKDLIGTRILFGGPSVHLTAAGAQAMGMALHELATNGAKHGSLSTSDGTVRILWEISSDEAPLFSIQWIEEGGAPIAAPTRKGFGHLVTGAIAESALGGKVAMDFPDTGLIWRLSAPVTDALERK